MEVRTGRAAQLPGLLWLPPTPHILMYQQSFGTRRCCHTDLSALHCFLCSYAEQLVLYLKVAELLSSGLQMAIEQIKAGKLCLSSTVKQGKGLLHSWGKGLTWNGTIKSVTEGMEGVE